MPEVWKTQARYRRQIGIRFETQNDALCGHVLRMPVGSRSGKTVAKRLIWPFFRGMEGGNAKQEHMILRRSSTFDNIGNH